jgi:hypothetical protein
MIESLVRQDDQGVERRYLIFTPPHGATDGARVLSV